MLGRQVRQRAHIAVNLHAGPNMKAGATVRKNQFHGSAALPVCAFLHRMSVDAVDRAKETIHRRDETDRRQRQQRVGEAVAGQCVVHDCRVHGEVGGIGTAVARRIFNPRRSRAGRTRLARDRRRENIAVRVDARRLEALLERGGPQSGCRRLVDDGQRRRVRVERRHLLAKHQRRVVAVRGPNNRCARRGAGDHEIERRKEEPAIGAELGVGNEAKYAEIVRRARRRCGEKDLCARKSVRHARPLRRIEKLIRNGHAVGLN